MSQDAINASAQNAVVAINGLNSVITSVSDSLKTIAENTASSSSGYGTKNSAATTGPSVLPLVQTNIYSGTGSLVKVSVIESGTTQGYIYDKASTGALIASAIAAIPATIGIYDLQIKFTLGIIIEPGINQTVMVSYTPD